MLSFHPYIPLALCAPLALAAAGLIAAYAVAARRRIEGRRRGWIIALMAVTLAAPLVVLLNPTWVQSVPPPPGKRLLTMLVDGTASMGTADADGTTRFQAAQKFAGELTKALGDSYEVRIRLFDEASQQSSAAQLASAAPEGSVTNLARAIESALGEDRPQGQAVLLASDGIDTSGTPVARLWQAADKGKALSTPIYTRAIGSQQGVSDLEVSLNVSQELAFVGQKVPVVVRLRHRGKSPATTQLTLSHEGQTLESQDVSLTPSGQVEQVVYVSQDAAGLFRYQLQADALEGEVTNLNNAASLLLRVVDEPVSVLLLEGKPYWDTKFLVRTLSADPSIALVSITQMAPGRFLQRRIALAESISEAPPASAPAQGGQGAADDVTPPDATASEPMPTGGDSQPTDWKIYSDVQQFLGDEKFLKSFQVVVLGRNTEAFMNEESLVGLRRWLQDDDGALVCFRGSPAVQMNQRLAALMPVRWAPGRESRFRVALTDSGAAMQWLPGAAAELSNLPSLAAAARPEEPKPLTTVLATSAGDGDQSMPLITYRPEGNGRVVVVEGAGMWRWAFLPPEHQQHDETYGTLWRSLMRWLVSNVGLLPTETIALRPDAVTFRSTQHAAATLLLREADWPKPPVIELSGDTLSSLKQFTPVKQPHAGGVYRVNFGQLPEGRYTARAQADRQAPGDAAAAKTEFEVTGNLQERLEIVVRPDVLAEVASRSGGAVLQTSEIKELEQHFDQHLARTRPQRVIRTPVWDRWWVLGGIFGLWAITWATRRWAGLV